MKLERIEGKHTLSLSLSVLFFISKLLNYANDLNYANKTFNQFNW